jgi:hypothetical protein
MPGSLTHLNKRVAAEQRQVKVAVPALIGTAITLGWAFVAFALADSLYGPMAIVASIATVAASVATYLWKPAEGREPVRVVGLMVLVQTFLSAGMSVIREVDRATAHSRPSPEAYTFATVSSVVFTFCFLAGLWIGAPGPSKKLPDPVTSSSGPTQSNIMILGLIASAVSISIALGLGRQLGVLPTILFNTSLTVPLFTAHYLMKGGSRVPLYIALFVQVILAIYSSMLGLAVLAIRDVLLTYVALRKRVPWGVVAVSIAAFLILNPAKALFRQQVSESGPVTFDQALVIWQESLADTWSTQTIERTEARDGALKTTTERLDYNWLSAHVYSVVPDRIPYQIGRTYEDVPLLLVPRVLYPEKPTSQGRTRSRWLIELGVQSSSSIDTVAISLPASAEAYWNFGWLGVFVVGVVLGLCVGSLFRIRIADPLGRVAWTVLVATTCTFFLDMVVWMVPQIVIAAISVPLVNFYCGLGRSRLKRSMAGKDARVGESSEAPLTALSQGDVSAN